MPTPCLDVACKHLKWEIPPEWHSLLLAGGGGGLLNVASGIRPTLRRGTLSSLSVYADVAYDHKRERDPLHNQLL